MRVKTDAIKLLERMNAEHRLGSIVGDGAELHDIVRQGALSYVDFHSAEVVELRRAQVRYLGALFPKASLSDLSERIFDVLDNDHLSRQDVRLILAGYSLSDASKRLNDTPIEVIQKVGELLADGRTQAEIARTIRVSEDTVYRIDKFLGLSEAWRDRQVAAAADALRDGKSVRQWAREAGLSKSTAHRFMQRAREVLDEIGE